MNNEWIIGGQWKVNKRTTKGHRKNNEWIMTGQWNNNEKIMKEQSNNPTEAIDSILKILPTYFRKKYNFF